MNARHFYLMTLAACCALSPAISAEESPWTLRFHGAIVDSSADSRTTLSGGFVSDVNVGGGAGVAAEYRFTKRLGFQVSMLVAGLEIGTSVGSSGTQTLDMGMAPLTFGLPVHLNPNGRADVFLEPTLSLVRFFDVETRTGPGVVGTTVNISSDTAPGAALCLDLPIGQRGWAFSTGLHYMKAEAEGADIDPVIVTIGAAYRFSGNRRPASVSRLDKRAGR